MFMGPRNWCQGMNSASLCSLAGRYENPIPPREVFSSKSKRREQITRGIRAMEASRQKRAETGQ